MVSFVLCVFYPQCKKETHVHIQSNNMYLRIFYPAHGKAVSRPAEWGEACRREVSNTDK